MLEITIPESDWFDERTQEFYYTKEKTIRLEHSLISLSKWESKWNKVFLDPKREKTREESFDYVRCMCLDKNVKSEIFWALQNYQMQKVNDYIQAPMTATWFAKEQPGSGHAGSRGETVTSELIYYWMIEFGIPFECEKWHLNRLLTLIRVCNIKKTPPKKMSQREIMERNSLLNAKRRARTGSKG